MSNLPSMIEGTTELEAAVALGGVPFPLPSYATPRLNPFDGQIGYNIKPSNTNRLRQAIAKVLAGAGIGELAVIGDSLSNTTATGVGVYQTATSWPSYFRQLLATRMGITVNDGWVRLVNGSSTALDTRWSFVGAWTNTGVFAFLSAAGSATLTTTNNGTSASVLWFDAGGSFTISMNGAGSGPGFATVNGVNSLTWKRTLLSGFAATNNMAITWVSGTIYAAAGAIYTSTMMVHNLSQAGATAAGVGVNSWTDPAAGNPWPTYIASHLIGLGHTDPDAIVIALGVNDISAATAPTTIIAAVRTILNAYPNSDIILMATQGLAPSLQSDAAWTAYVAQLYNLADTLNLPLLDLRALLGSYATYLANGLTVDNFGHLTAQGNAVEGMAVTKALT